MTPPPALDAAFDPTLSLDRARPAAAPRTYAPREWLLVMGLVLLSGADALATLLWVREGGVEVNPLMAWALARGPVAFASLKMGVTTLGAAALLHRADAPGTRLVVRAAFGAYLLVVLYHTWLHVA